MGKGMEESDAEGVAIHGGPESCVGDPRGSSEALTGVRAGRAIEPRNQCNQGAHVVSLAEGNIADGAVREPSADPARSKNLSMYGVPMRENREIPRSPAQPINGRAAQGRPRPQA